MHITNVQSVARTPPESLLRSKIQAIGTLKDHSSPAESFYEDDQSSADHFEVASVCGHKTALTHCTRCICSEVVHKYVVSSSLWAVSQEVYSQTNKCVWCWKFGGKKKQLLSLSQPLECLKGRSSSEWCFHFSCSRGYQSASMCHLLFVFSMLNF